MRRMVGSTSVTSVTDASGRFFSAARDAFPTAGEAAWEAARLLDPTAFEPDDGWRLQFRCFLVQPAGGPTVLVDAGIGPVGAPASRWAPVPGRLPAELASVGVAPTEVDIVVLTHLHTDHIGWAVGVADGRPTFPNARYVLQRADHDAADTMSPALREFLLDPLHATGQLHLADGEVPLGTGLRAVPAPGHTPGHQVVLVGDDRPLVITGDLLVHAVQLADPTVTYAHDADPELARTSRLRLFSQAAELATSHLTDPFHPVPPPP